MAQAVKGGSPPLEKVIVKSVIDKLNKIKGVHAIKTHGGAFGCGGQPDVSGCIDGRRFDLEGKRPGKELSARQKKVLGVWKKAGSITGMFTSWIDVLRVFDEHGIDLEERTDIDG